MGKRTLHARRQSVDQRALHAVVPQSMRTTNARCTALATLHHRSPRSHLDRRLPSIEFNIQHRAARALHLTAIGEQKIKPLAYMSSRLSPSCRQAFNTHPAALQQDGQRQDLESRRVRFRPVFTNL
ncbi:hypothetical protein ALO41_102723 [Pseudomonas amygdali pv. ulmi]|uniref:Uncharacterized protein n=2 Tax=Pseudomonas amygdali TaxID=47877 RepID=A0A0Q0IUH5_PSEA0|nr:hypothetical protein ALO90_102940 [Pseudomonas amygdali pv. aesculi]KPZ05118.1 hypothetical protein ALO41_102723 [Pseudomonas amygdali pv. ulmi]